MRMKWKFPREKTAIHHPNNLSVAANRALLEGVIKKMSIVLDYGCGHGDDVRLLREKGYRWVIGWDPAFLPTRERILLDMGAGNPSILLPPQHPANVVLLSNVINVIESPEERRHVLQSAFRWATECLVVTAYSDGSGRKWGDGVVTSKGTFQKPYTRKGFEALVRNALRDRAGKIKFSTGNLAFIHTKEACP